MIRTTKEEVLRHLKQLVGRKLAIARRAADLRGFHFGRVTEDGSRNQSQGEFVLHIQCPWRVEGPDGIVTGRSDLWEPADLPEKLDRDIWDYETNENLQDRRIGQLLGAYDPKTRSSVNSTRHLVVEAVEADDFGGAVLSLSGGYRIAIFPSGSTGEPGGSFDRHSLAILLWRAAELRSCPTKPANRPLQPTSGTDVVPTSNSVRTELLIRRLRLSGMTLDRQQ